MSKYKFKEYLDDSDMNFFLSLFTLHDEYESKVGVGVSKLQVDRDFHGNKCIRILRFDGSAEGISWRHCINPISVDQNISNAFRRAVKEAVISFRDQCLGSGVRNCPYTDMILDKHNSNVSYRNVAFEKILGDFLTESCINKLLIELTDPTAADPDQRAIISDFSIITKWRLYHENNSELVLVSKVATLRRLIS